MAILTSIWYCKVTTQNNSIQKDTTAYEKNTIDRFSDKRFYYANAPPCKQGFSLTTDFTWRILLCTKKFLIRFDLLRINGISRIPRFMHTVPVLLIFEPHSQGYRCINNWRCWYIPNWKETFRDFTGNIQSLPFRNPLLLQKNIEEELGWWWHTSYEKGQKVTNGAYKNRNISYSWCYAKSEAQSYDCYYVFRRTSCFRSHTSSLWWYFTHEKNIHIRDGKSRSDRYTLLADRTLEILTEYWFQCGRPRGILFPSSWTGDYLTKDSVIQFFRESAKRAGIQKHVSTHCLRHSFASHLFESGCDVKYIQALLGHRDPKSTEVYLHVSNKTLLGIRSPFDEMGGEWLWRNHVRYRMYLNGFILLMKRGIALLLIIEKQLIISWTVKQALLV